MNKEFTPLMNTLVKVEFEQTIPDVSYYRHNTWPSGFLKRFRSVNTMSSNAKSFDYFNPIGWEKEWKL